MKRSERASALRSQGIASRVLARPALLRAAGIAGSLLLWAAGLVMWWIKPNSIFGWQGVSWVASMALFVATCALWPAWGSRATTKPEKVAWTRPEVVTFAALVLLSFVMRLAWLEEVPWRFHYDEALAYTESLRFYKGPPISLFTVTWANTGMPSLIFAYTGGLLHLVGEGLGAGRTGVATLGALTVVPVYFLGRLLSGRLAAMLAGLAWATSAVAVHYSRVSIPNLVTGLFWCACFYLLLRALSWRKPLDFALAGLVAGLSMYTYYASRLLPYLLIAYFLYLAVMHRQMLRETLKGFGLVAVGYLVGFGPFLAFFMSKPGVWFGRGTQSLIIPPVVPTSLTQIIDDWNIVTAQFWQTLAGFGFAPSNDNVYWGSFFLPMEVPLFALGAILITFRWKRPEWFLMLMWGAGVFFMGGVLIDNLHVPAFARWTPAFPVYILAVAVGIDALAGWQRGAAPHSAPPGAGSRWRVGVYGAIALCAAIIAVANVYYYFVLYPQRVPPSFEAEQGRFLATLDARDRVYFVGNSWQGYYADIARMVAPQITGGDLLNPSMELPVAGAQGQHNVFVFNYDEVHYLPLIEQLYPGGRFSSFASYRGNVARVYKVASSGPSQKLWPISPAHGMAATLVDWGGTIKERRRDWFLGAGLLDAHPAMINKPWERDPGFKPFLPDGTYRVRWEGELLSEQGIYTMEVRTDARVRLWVDDKPVLDLCDNKPADPNIPEYGGHPWATGAVHLAAGLHPVRIDYEATGNLNGLEWAWTRPDGVREIVPPWSLRHTDGVWPAAPSPLSCER